MLIQLRRLTKEKLKSSKTRHLLKTVTWRVVGSIDTWILASFVTNSAGKGGLIAAVEVVSKMILYYLHERIWYRIQFGVNEDDHTVSRKRHIVKAVSWRVIGTLDTMLLAWLITGNAMDGLKIGLFELVTKMALYYFHERAWTHVNLKYFNEKS